MPQFLLKNTNNTISLCWKYAASLFICGLRHHMHWSTVEDIQKELIEISRVILDPLSSDFIAQEACQSLFNWYLRILDIETYQGSETTNAHGLALSPQHAAECILDFKRTTYFLRGTLRAVRDTAARFPDSPLHLLYAGTGPCATLIVPLIHLFQPDQVRLYLMDIHEESIHTLQNIMEKLKYLDYVEEFIVADAAIYTCPEETPFHLIVCEVMFEGLTKEPQVKVSGNLVSLLKINGIFIPENIDISASYSVYSREKRLLCNQNEYLVHPTEASPYADRIPLGKVCSINKSTLLDMFKISTPLLESQWYRIPDEYEGHPDLLVLTEVTVYKNYVLKGANSAITNPHCVASIPNFENYTYIKLKYIMNGIPKWEYELSQTI